jgi:hypothetical protein
MVSKADDNQKYGIEWALDGIKANQNPFEISKEMMNQCVGNYGPRHISMKDGNLFYQREGNTKYQLIPMKEDLFMIKEIPYFRIKMIREGKDIVALKGLYDNGRTDKNKRSK